MREFRLTTAAEVDYNEAVVVLFLSAIRDAFKRIRSSPESYEFIFASRVRRTPVHKFPYVVHYTLEDDRILIQSVFHTSRDPVIWQGRLD